MFQTPTIPLTLAVLVYVAAFGAVASIAAARVAAIVYRRLFDEDPPD